MKTGLRFLFSCCLFLILGCGESITVNLPSHFHGGVLIGCGSGEKVSAISTSVDIDSRGIGTLERCPEKPVRLVILRDGKRVLPSPSHLPAWNKTPDGVLAGVEFVVP